MLETIKECIEAPYISFEQYFINYVISVQDTNIDNEMSFLCKHNFLNVNSMIRLSSVVQKELESFDKCI